MAKKDKLQEPMSDAERSAARIREIAAQVETDTARDVLDKFLETKLKLNSRQRDYMLHQEFDRVPARQPKQTPSGGIARAKRDGSLVDMLDENYWREGPNGDLIPKTKLNVGDELLSLAADGVENLTIQSQMLKAFGPEATMGALRLVGGELGKITPKKPLPGAKTGPGVVDSTNPWANNAPGSEQARIDVIRRLGTKAASGMAKAAGVDLAGRKLNVTPKAGV